MTRSVSALPVSAWPTVIPPAEPSSVTPFAVPAEKFPARPLPVNSTVLTPPNASPLTVTSLVVPR